jgi:DNA polymerase I-like protein with 3'-5' exonuclease and polymerase domains
MLSGRKRWLGKYEQTYKGFNQLIQGGVSEMIKAAMLAADEIATTLGGKVVLQIHDSIEIEVPEEAAAEAADAMESAMTLAMPVALSNRTDPPIMMHVDEEVWA